MKKPLFNNATHITKYIYLPALLCCLVLNTQAQNWQFTQRYTPTDVKAHHRFGNAVDIDGNYAIAGAYYQSSTINDDTLAQSGTVYLFEKDLSGTWNEVQKLNAPDAAPFNYFGNDVGISGTTLVVGAYYNNTDDNLQNPKPAAGAVYIFERNENGIWEFWQKLTASDRDTLDWFGKKLKLKQDQLVIAAPGVDSQNVQAIGSVYYFTKDENGYWTEQQKITPPDNTAYKKFGTSIAYNENYMVVGAPFESDTLTNNGIREYQRDYGSAYIYKKQADENWVFVQKLQSPSWFSTFFASSVGTVTLNENPTQILIGHPSSFYDIENVNGEAGAIYVYTENENGLWNRTDAIVPREIASEDSMQRFFGFSFDIDSNVLVSNGSIFFEFNQELKWRKIQQGLNSTELQSDIYFYSLQDLALSKNTLIWGLQKLLRTLNGTITNTVVGGGISFISKDVLPLVPEFPVMQQSLINPNLIGDDLYFNIHQFPNLKNIRVIDMQGKVVLTQHVHKTPKHLIFSKPPGIYGLIAEDAKGNFFYQKIIKNK